MSVYYIHAPDLGMVKIGFAKKPLHRFSKMQSDSPSRLILLAAEEGDADTEAVRHAQFSRFRRRGEWFSFEGELAEFVSSLTPFVRVRKRKPLSGPLGAWLIANNLTGPTFAKMVGVSQGTISKICTGKMIPQPAIMRRIYAATEGEVDANALYGLTPDLLDEEAVA